MGANDAAELRPLFSVDAEQSLLGALLSNNESYDSLSGLITTEHFYSGDHQLIARAIFDLIEMNKAADVLTVAERLRSQGNLERVGGFEYLHMVADSMPSSARVLQYAEIVREHFIRKRLHSVAQQISESVQRASGIDGQALLEEAHQRILAITETSSGQRGSVKPLQEGLQDLMMQLDDAAQQIKQGGRSGLSTGFDEIDDLTGGMKPGQLFVLAGRPGMGKTAFAVNVAEHVALVSKLPVLIFSMEMAQSEVALRLLASQTRVHSIRLSHGRISPGEWDDLNKGLVRLHDAPIFICEDGGLTLTELKAGARRFRRHTPKIGLVVVDYFGLMQVERPSSNHAQDLAKVSAGFKAFAKEMKVPVMLLAQLNREVEKRPNKRPVLSDLRDSGGLEQDADLVAMLYRDEVYREDSMDKGAAEFLLRKQRSGPVGMVKLSYQAQFTRFRNYERV